MPDSGHRPNEQTLGPKRNSSAHSPNTGRTQTPSRYSSISGTQKSASTTSTPNRHSGGMTFEHACGDSGSRKTTPPHSNSKNAYIRSYSATCVTCSENPRSSRRGQLEQSPQLNSTTSGT